MIILKNRLIAFVCVLTVLVTSSVAVFANNFTNIDNTEIIKPPDIVFQDKNATLKNVKTFTVNGKDENGRDYVDNVTQYQFSLQEKNGTNEATVTATTTLPPINAKVESVLRVYNNSTDLSYFGRCYAPVPVTATMSCALLWWGSDTWLVEQQSPPYARAGTAVATPIYTFRNATTGYWQSRNVFNLSAPDYLPTSGKAYSGSHYIDAG